MFDLGTKKKGFLSAVMVCIAFPVMGLVVSCGYQTNETVQTDTNTGETAAAETESAESGTETESQNAAEQSGSESFDYNNEYNEMARVYKNNVYLAKENGIYCIKDGQGDGTLLYQDDYRLRRRMEIDQNFLYFCGSVLRGDEFGATIYRMDLDTGEIVDALAAFSQKFESLYNISIYEGNLYVAGDHGSRIGFALDQNGGITRPLDEKTDDFLYREYNDYVELEWKKNWDTEYDSDEYRDLAEQLGEKYAAVIDVGACKKLLNGSQVVSRYKNEALRSFYLEKKDGTYELLCDSVYSLSPIIAENGMYYFDEINSKESCEDAVAMRNTAETFAAAYFENDEAVLRSLLSEDFAGTADLYDYPENAAQIRENYLAGLPDDNIETGVTCWLSYEFGGHAESDGAYVYLSMEVTKTKDGFRIRSYGLEQ